MIEEFAYVACLLIGLALGILWGTWGTFRNIRLKGFIKTKLGTYSFAGKVDGY